MIKYSIIIPTYNNLPVLKECISSIQKYTNLDECEVIIIANGCEDKTEEYLISLPSEFVFLSYPEPLGYAKANNRGIDIAKGEYIILLNDDTKLLEQPKNTWLQMLEDPFNLDPNVGITGPHSGFIGEGLSNERYIMFFCAMIHRSVIEKVGKLDEGYGQGFFEDIDYCLNVKKAGYLLVRVPEAIDPRQESDHNQEGDFPIFHASGITMEKIPDWQELYQKNKMKFAKKHNAEWYKSTLHNNFERAVFNRGDKIDPRETARYTFAAKHLKGKKVLEIGCSSGFGVSFLPEDINYTGIDYSLDIIEHAREQFGDRGTFICSNINTFEFEHYDTIIAFEILEHIENGREMAQKLKEYCDVLLISAPYNEEPGFWGIHHKLHRLTEEDFPGFSYHYISDDGRLIKVPEHFDGRNLLLMKWERPEAIEVKEEATEPVDELYDIKERLRSIERKLDKLLRIYTKE